MIPSSVWMITVTSPQLAMSTIASANLSPGAKRRISAGIAANHLAQRHAVLLGETFEQRARIGGENAAQVGFGVRREHETSRDVHRWKRAGWRRALAGVVGKVRP